MTATWTLPKTWAVGEKVTAAMMNQYIRDNMDWLKTPPQGVYLGNESADIGLTNTSFAVVDTSKFRITLTTTGGSVLVFGLITFINSTPTSVFWDIAANGTRKGGDDGLCLATGTSATQRLIAPVWTYFNALAAGVWNFDLWNRQVSGTTTISMGAGTANSDVHPQWFAAEML
jgi:hypothetical protein